MNKSFYYTVLALFALTVTTNQSHALSSKDIYLTAGDKPAVAHGDGKMKDGTPAHSRKDMGSRKRDRDRDDDRGGVTLFPSFGFGIGTGHGYRHGPSVDFGIGTRVESRRDYRDEECEIKGVYRRDGRRVYYTPDSERYDDVDADRMFCSRRQAERNGFRESWR